MFIEETEIDSNLTDRFSLAHDVVRRAGATALDYFNRREQLTVETKADLQDVVSIADRDVEQIIRSEIGHRFPDDGFLGEEHGRQEGESGYLWVIDPIDGTACFLTGMRPWCLSVALMKGNRLAAGFIYDPNTDELFSALSGKGAELNGKAIRVHSSQTIRQGVMGVGMSHRVPADTLVPFLDRLLSGGGMFIRNGSCALMMAYVAAGRLIGYFEPHINSWDCLAGIVLVREAGGWTSPFLESGGLENGSPILAAANGVAGELRSLTGLT